MPMLAISTNPIEMDLPTSALPAIAFVTNNPLMHGDPASTMEPDPVPRLAMNTLSRLVDDR